jgi:D-amino peptidase
MKRHVVIAVASLLALLPVFTPAQARQQKKLKVYISADMEGIGGVSTWKVQASSEGREFEKFARLMTLEVNAAIAGAFDAGATEVLVADSHGDAQNIDVELLDERARLIRAWPRPLGMVQGIDETTAAAVFVGYHAGQDSPAATLAHTILGDGFKLKLNGTEVPEAGLGAAIAGDFGVPVVFLSGDQTIGAEARRLLGPIETVAVKQASGFHAATMLHPEESRRLIREGVKRGIDRRASLQPYKVTHPVELDVTFTKTVNAELAAYLPDVKRLSGDTVRFTAKDMTEASKFLEAVTGLNTY